MDSIQFQSEINELAKTDEIKRLSAEIDQNYFYPAERAKGKKDYDKATSLAEGAVSHWQMAKDNAYKQFRIYRLLEFNAELYERMKAYDKVEQTYEKMKVLCPDNPGYPQIDLRLAEVREKREDYKGAEAALRDYLEKVDSGLVDLHCLGETDSDLMRTGIIVRIASALELQKRLDEAQTELSKALQQSEQSKQPQSTRSLRVAYKDFLQRHNGDSDKIKVLEKQLQDDHCPVCGSNQNNLRITYGLQYYVAPGTHPGGCCSGPDSPKFYCTTDKVKF